MSGGIYRPQRNWGARIHELAYREMPLIVLENELLRIGVLAGKGADIIELNYKPRDLDFVWLRPGGAHNVRVFAPTTNDERSVFRDVYPGGWQEMFPSAGNPSVHAGASHNQHGEVFNVPWDVAIEEDTASRVAVRFAVRPLKSPVLLERTISLESGADGFRFDERITNESPVAVRAMWGHHITFGPPFLQPGCRIRLPADITIIPHGEAVGPGGRRVSGTDPFAWPIDPGSGVDLSEIPTAGSLSDLVYLAGYSDAEGWYEVTNPELVIGARVAWDGRLMPYLWYWQEFGASTGYPWYGRNFNIGLEPCSSMPSSGLAEAVRNGTALTIDATSSRSSWLEFQIVNAH